MRSSMPFVRSSDSAAPAPAEDTDIITAPHRFMAMRIVLVPQAEADFRKKAQ